MKKEHVKAGAMGCMKEREEGINTELTLSVKNWKRQRGVEGQIGEDANTTVSDRARG